MELSEKDFRRFDAKIAKDKPNKCWHWTGWK
jgi:hypothetical protein